MSKEKQTEEQVENKAYKLFSHTFRDEFAEKDITVEARFRKPTKSEVNMMQQTAIKNPQLASHNLLISIINAEDKDRFINDCEEYPGIVLTFSSIVLQSVGISSELGKR